jgi:hypothetical protein
MMTEISAAFLFNLLLFSPCGMQRIFHQGQLSRPVECEAYSTGVTFRFPTFAFSSFQLFALPNRAPISDLRSPIFYLLAQRAPPPSAISPRLPGGRL